MISHRGGRSNLTLAAAATLATVAALAAVCAESSRERKKPHDPKNASADGTDGGWRPDASVVRQRHGATRPCVAAQLLPAWDEAREWWELEAHLAQIWKVRQVEILALEAKPFTSRLRTERRLPAIAATADRRRSAS